MNSRFLLYLRGVFNKAIIAFALVGYSYFEKGCRKKVHATILKGIVGDFKCTVFQRNLKESYGRPLIYVCEC